MVQAVELWIAHFHRSDVLASVGETQEKLCKHALWFLTKADALHGSYIEARLMQALDEEKDPLLSCGLLFTRWSPSQILRFRVAYLM